MSLNATIKAGLIERELQFAKWYAEAKEWSNFSHVQEISWENAPQFPGVKILGHELDIMGVRIPREREGDKEKFVQEIMMILLQRAIELYGRSVLVGKWNDNGLCIVKQVGGDMAYFYTIFNVDGNILNVSVNYDAAQIKNPATFESTIVDHDKLISLVQSKLFRSHRLRNPLVSLVVFLLAILGKTLGKTLEIIGAIGDVLSRGSRSFSFLFPLAFVEQIVIVIICGVIAFFAFALILAIIMGIWASFSDAFLVPYADAKKRFEYFRDFVPSAGLVEPRVTPTNSVQTLLEGSKDHRLYVDYFMDMLRQIQVMTKA
jgi:hypothetical protein